MNARMLSPSPPIGVTRSGQDWSAVTHSPRLFSIGISLEVVQVEHSVASAGALSYTYLRAHGRHPVAFCRRIRKSVGFTEISSKFATAPTPHAHEVADGGHRERFPADASRTGWYTTARRTSATITRHERFNAANWHFTSSRRRSVLARVLASTSNGRQQQVARVFAQIRKHPRRRHQRQWPELLNHARAVGLGHAGRRPGTRGPYHDGRAKRNRSTRRSRHCNGTGVPGVGTGFCRTILLSSESEPGQILYLALLSRSPSRWWVVLPSVTVKTLGSAVVRAGDQHARVQPPSRAQCSAARRCRCTADRNCFCFEG